MEERENDEELLREGKALAALLLEAEKEKDEGKVYAVEINNSSDKRTVMMLLMLFHLCSEVLRIPTKRWKG